MAALPRQNLPRVDAAFSIFCHWRTTLHPSGDGRAKTEYHHHHEDPKESTNIAQKHPEKVKELHRHFLREQAKDRKTKSNL